MRYTAAPVCLGIASRSSGSASSTVIPVARTFGGVVGQAAGAQRDNFGISFAGATSVENVYIVEGINTTDTAYGGLSSNLPN